jgi:hypothetical protein
MSDTSHCDLAAVLPYSEPVLISRLNTFVFLPASGGPRFPVILHRTPYDSIARTA